MVHKMEKACKDFPDLYRLHLTIKHIPFLSDFSIYYKVGTYIKVMFVTDSEIPSGELN